MMIQDALFRQCLAAMSEEQKAEFELSLRATSAALGIIHASIIDERLLSPVHLDLSQDCLRNA